MEKNDHISLMLPMNVNIDGSESTGESTIAATLTEERLNFRRISKLNTRKSIRRSWNQLPRCQRNLIVLGISALCITLVLFLPGDQIISDTNSNNNLPGTFPFLSRPRSVPKDELKNRLENSKDTQDLKINTSEELNGNALPLKQPDIPQNHQNVENVAKIPESQKAADARAELASQSKDKDDKKNNIDIHEITGNNFNGNENNINNNEVEENQGDRPALEEAVKDPGKLPGPNGLAIEEFVLRLQAPTGNDTLKMAFNGATNERQQAVVAAFKHSWEGYKKYAWGHDNLKPISMGSHDWFGLGLTIVDSLDTIYIMGLEEEFLEAREWVNEFLKFDINRDVNLFEVTIRVLGGLLSTYHLSGDKMFLQKSVELGNRLLPCFLSPSGIPYSDVNLATMTAHSPGWSPDSSTSEVTTIQLEFRDLSRVTNVPMYEKVVDIVNEKVHALEKKNGLVPIFINANTGSFSNYATISLGARGDSYYEYLLKQWIQKGCKKNDYLITDYMQSIDGVLTQLMRRTHREQHVYIGELIHGREFKPKMDHLTCYLPGTLLLGHKYGMPESHLQLAYDLLETCYQTYMKQPTKLAPEISYFAINDNEEFDIYVRPNDAHNLLRPEFIESLYYFYALTGNRTYQDMGWNIFQAFEKYTKVAHGYTSIGNVKNIFNTRPRDMMESFWLGETLKYFYLLFSDNRKEIDLDKYVFNTEAHPLPIPSNNMMRK